MMRHTPGFLLASLLAVSVGCQPPDISELREDAVVSVLERPEDAEALFVDAVLEAEESLHVALPDVENPELVEALLDRWIMAEDSGEDFELELIVDVNEIDTPEMDMLLSYARGENPGRRPVPVQYSGRGVGYFEFALNDGVGWTSDQTRMSHAYLIADRRRVVAATTAGHVRTGPRIALEIRGEDLIEDLLTEHNQIFSGIDATALTAFDAPAKSIADFRWRYETTSDWDLEMWLGPQERTTKRMIDAVYSARSAVWLVADDIANEGLARALQEKARWGFDVRVVVGPGFRSNSAVLSGTLLANRGDLEVVQVSDVDALPNYALIDLPRDREGYAPHARAMILTHDLVSSARLYRGRPVVTDQFIDGVLWQMSDHTPDRADMQDLADLFDDLYDRGEPL